MVEDGNSTAPAATRSAWSAAALGGAAAIVVLHVVLSVRPDDGLLFLLAAPVALIAFDHGPRAAALAVLAASALAVATIEGQEHELSALGYATRALAYLLAGGAAAWLGRRATAEEVAVPEAAPARPVSASHPLTARELQVLGLIASGHTNKEAALALGISVRTVESHRANVQQKLSCWGRSDLFRRAQELGLIAS